MDIHRLFIILSISLIFITLFCDDDLIEGNNGLELDSTVDQTMSSDGGDQRSEVDVTLSGERSSGGRSVSEMNSSSSNDESLTIDIKEREDKSKDKKVFGLDCVKNCRDYYHSCEAKTEYKRDHRGKRVSKTTYGHKEGCLHGELPEKTCDTEGWFCKDCNDGYYALNGVCKKRPHIGIIIIIVLIVVILGVLFILGREYLFAVVRGAGDKRGRGTMDIRVVDGNKI